MPAVPTTPRVKLRVTSRRVPRSRAVAGDAEAEVDSEPNMRLSRAILVMLLLHLVAIGGILAFSLIKEHNADRLVHDPNNSTAGALEAEDSLVPTTKPVPHVEPLVPAGKLPVHVVQPGETLLRIANENGVTVEALIAANGAHTAMSSLRPGQSLKLPDRSPDPAGDTPGRAAANSERVNDLPLTGTGGSQSASATSSKATRVPADSGRTYTVGKGESPFVIAQKLKVSYDSLIRLNHIDDPKKLKPGQKLRIPGSAVGKTKEG